DRLLVDLVIAEPLRPVFAELDRHPGALRLVDLFAHTVPVVVPDRGLVLELWERQRLRGVLLRTAPAQQASVRIPGIESPGEVAMARHDPIRHRPDMVWSEWVGRDPSSVASRHRAQKDAVQSADGTALHHRKDRHRAVL